MGLLRREDFEKAAAVAGRDSGTPLHLSGYHAHGAVFSAARFVLPNGLTCILLPDNRAPIFAYQTWFRVGSKHEDPKRTGMAHLFEHLMFKGTRTYPTGTFDAEMEARGAQTNAATWVDWTYYTQSLAARGDNLDTVVAFEADRMVNLTLDDTTFRSELEVVKNERRLSVEDSVVGTMSEHLMSLCYQQHPYRWPTLGSMAHLQAASIADLRAFYETYYAPNNAAVVLVGDIDLTSALTLLARAYGSLAKQPLHRPALCSEPIQKAARWAQARCPVMAPQLLIGYRAPAQTDPRYAVVEVLAEILAAGDTARLYQALVTEQKLCSEIQSSVTPFCEPGVFEIYAAARDGVDVQSVVEAIDAEFARLQDGLHSFEMEKAKCGLELAQLEALKDVEGCAEALGHFETNEGDFAKPFRLLDAYQAVTPQQVLALACDMFVPERRSVVVAQPQPVEPDGQGSQR